MAPSLVPVQGVPRLGVPAFDPLSASQGSSAYLTSQLAHADLHGAGHPGVAPLDRIIMALKSGLAPEIEHALSTLTFYSCNDPKLVDFNAYPLIGNALVSYFARPYLALSSCGSEAPRILPAELLASVEALLSLRNAAQDLPNQQWLSQQPQFRKHAVDALRFLVAWFFSPSVPRLHALERASDTLRESLKHLVDILDPVTSFYVETPKNDPLFQQLLILLTGTQDKHVLVAVLRCLQHLLFLGGAGGVSPRDPEQPDCNNCIDAVQPVHLSTVVRCLLVQDDELNHAVLLFLKQYLVLEALHARNKTSVKQSQLYRLRVLTGSATSSENSLDLLENLHVLMKQLPTLIVVRLPLVDPLQVPMPPSLRLQTRSSYSGVPAATARLPDSLYKVILAFPEPLRATTWLRCCYEPHAASPQSTSTAADLPSGEVTQISLWKAYENQFEAIWKDRFNPRWPNLLPAVDFIKNVSLAFPSSEAMVVSVPASDPSQAPRKKFIIKGIQPRQFPVSIDIGNFEALRKSVVATDADVAGSSATGDDDAAAFQARMEALTDSLLSASDDLSDPADTSVPWYSPINVLSRDILKILISSLLCSDAEGIYKNVFRQYNSGWLPDLVYANPGVVEQGYVDGKWLQYLL